MEMELVFRIIVFIVASMIILFLSRVSIRKDRNHGLYRFFALESILAVLMLNINYLVRDPLSSRQIISWIFIVFSLIFAGQGIWLMKTVGKPRVGIYKYIRHPIYGALLFLAFGICLKRFTIVGLILAHVTMIFLILTARIEDEDNIRKFGSEHRKYMESTKRFLPYLM